MPERSIPSTPEARDAERRQAEVDRAFATLAEGTKALLVQHPDGGVLVVIGGLRVRFRPGDAPVLEAAVSMLRGRRSR